MTKAPKRFRWRSLLAGILIFLFGAPLVNLGTLGILFHADNFRGGFRATDGIIALGLGLLIMGLSFWLLATQVKLDNYTGLPRRLQFLEYGSFVLISLGFGIGLTSYPGEAIDRVYAVLLFTGLILGMLFVLGRLVQVIQVLRKKY